MTRATQTIAVIITFRKSNKISLERRAGVYLSRGGDTLYFKLSQLLCLIFM